MGQSSVKNTLSLRDEEKRMLKLLKNKIVSKVFRHRAKEVGLEFTDGTRMFIDHLGNRLDITIT